ncbi:NAD-dependent epimerase/dehydratase family protein [Lacticaseibacillus baoqingensis]|uniref:NAD-dependent epimerase/dehydratase family protein n=1 Tax=Lacticaseibacillus baoqingensis TaxID=2486013 RepID=A0ABW4E220_9LACO|nr:NAD-dependent epimerase/dehydratase family protein [Lacticaseibacillus baoqingensis]
MSTVIDPVLSGALDDLVQTQKAHLTAYKGKRVLITGATGLVARILTLLFLRANDRLHLGLQVVAIARNPQKVTRLYGALAKRPDITFVYQDIKQPYDQITEPVDFIFHAAAVTSSKQLIAQPVEAFSAQVLGMMNILNRARQDHAKVVYLSSMEIYGQPFVERRATEADVGYVDPLVVRNGYPESKRSNEFLASAFYHEFGVDVVNARLAQTFGPGVAADDSRVFAQFARSALKHEALVLHTDGTSMGNYCYLPDTIAALLTLSIKGAAGEAYNVVNEAATVSIKQLAELVATNFGNGQVVIDIPEQDMGYAPQVQLRLSGKKLAALGWQPTAGLLEMFAQTIKSWEAMK